MDDGKWNRRRWEFSQIPSPGRLSPLTSADGPVVAPGHDDVADSLAGDALGALQVVALVAGELDAGAQPGERTEGTSASSCLVHGRIWGQSHPLAPQAEQGVGREQLCLSVPQVLMSKSHL